jgi:hypothetical protein
MGCFFHSRCSTPIIVLWIHLLWCWSLLVCLAFPDILSNISKHVYGSWFSWSIIFYHDYRQNVEVFFKTKVPKIKRKKYACKTCFTNHRSFDRHRFTLAGYQIVCISKKGCKNNLYHINCWVTCCRNWHSFCGYNPNNNSVPWKCCLHVLAYNT